MTATNDTTADGPTTAPGRKSLPDEYYEEIKAKFKDERDIRMALRPEGTKQYIYDLTGDLERYAVDPWVSEVEEREPLTDTVDVLFIGGGFSGLLASARLRERGVEKIRIVERGADVGGVWYWNRYPGVSCDVIAYDYLPLLDETGYVPTRHYARGDEIWAYCQSIAERYNLYDHAVFQTTVTSTVWDEDEQLWHVETDRGDHMKAQFVVCANGNLTKPKLSKIDGMEKFKGHSFHSSRWEYDYTGDDLSKLSDKVVGVIGTGATGVQAIPEVGKTAKELYVFQRTPSPVEVRADWDTDPEWAAKLEPGWQAKRREKAKHAFDMTPEQKAARVKLTKEEKRAKRERANIRAMMQIHKRIEDIVEDPETAESLKPWYLIGCKRPTFHNEYLETFNRPNVHLVDTKGKGITEITENGPVFEGKEYELDLLIYATGFEVQKTGTYNRIVGVGGVELSEKYEREGVRTLFGVHSHGFPNLFIMNNMQSSFQFNLTDVMQVQGDHIAACVDHVRSNGYQTVDVKDETEEYWVQEVIKFRGTSSRNSQCTPGYFNFEGENRRKQDAVYNGGFNRYCREVEEVAADLEKHYDFEAKKEGAVG